MYMYMYMYMYCIYCIYMYTYILWTHAINSESTGCGYTKSMFVHQTHGAHHTHFEEAFLYIFLFVVFGFLDGWIRIGKKSSVWSVLHLLIARSHSKPIATAQPGYCSLSSDSSEFANVFVGISRCICPSYGDMWHQSLTQLFPCTRFSFRAWGKEERDFQYYFHPEFMEFVWKPAIFR